VGDIPALKKLLGTAAETHLERESELRRLKAARAINYALNRGASAAALRGVTTKDHDTFEEYVAIGMSLELTEGEGWAQGPPD
jgi:hypothetical protein